MFCSMYHSQCQVQIFQQKTVFLRGGVLVGERIIGGFLKKHLTSSTKLRMSFTNSEFYNKVITTQLLYPTRISSGILKALHCRHHCDLCKSRDLSNPVTTNSTTKPVWGLLKLVGYRKMVRKWNHSESPNPNFSQLFSFPLPPTFFKKNVRVVKVNNKIDFPLPTLKWKHPRMWYPQTFEYSTTEYLRVHNTEIFDYV